MTMSSTPEQVETLIRNRRSIRAYLDTALSPSTLRSVFELASMAPSNANVQPWRVEVVSGAVKDRLTRDLIAAHNEHRLSPDFAYDEDLYSPEHKARAQETGAIQYGALGIERDDRASRDAYVIEGLKFYGAPHVALLFMPDNAEQRIATDTGIYAQTLLTALTGYGVGSVPLGLIGFYAATVRKSLGLGDGRLLMSIAFGYPDTSAAINHIVTPRADLSETTTFRPSLSNA